MSELLFRCDECGRVHKENEIKLVTIRVERPDGNVTSEQSQCPECGWFNGFTNICDEPGCEQEATSGWPSDKGYRRTCGKHHYFDQKEWQKRKGLNNGD